MGKRREEWQWYNYIIAPLFWGFVAWFVVQVIKLELGMIKVTFWP